MVTTLLADYCHAAYMVNKLFSEPDSQLDERSNFDFFANKIKVAAVAHLRPYWPIAVEDAKLFLGKAKAGSDHNDVIVHVTDATSTAGADLLPLFSMLVRFSAEGIKLCRAWKPEKALTYVTLKPTPLARGARAFDQRRRHIIAQRRSAIAKAAGRPVAKATLRAAPSVQPVSSCCHEGGTSALDLSRLSLHPVAAGAS